MSKNYLTTIPGILLVLAGIFMLITDPTLKEVALSILLTGIGLLGAKAYNVTGVGDDAKTTTEVEQEKDNRNKY